MKKLFLLVILTATLFACKQHTTDFSTILSSKAPGAPISFEETKLLIETFKKYAIPVPGGKDVTRSVWFDIKQIHRIDSLLKDEESKGMKTDGIRIYFGTYPQKDLHGKAYDYPFQNTVIFVSTKDSIADNQHYHQNYYDHPEVHPMVPENRGELCEPNCKGNNGL